MNKEEFRELPLTEQIGLSFKAGIKVEKTIIEVLDKCASKKGFEVNSELEKQNVIKYDRESICKISLDPRDIAYSFGATAVFVGDILHKTLTKLTKKSKDK